MEPCYCGDPECRKCFPGNVHHDYDEHFEDENEMVKCLTCYNLVHESKDYCDSCEYDRIEKLLRESRENETEAYLNTLAEYDEY